MFYKKGKIYAWAGLAFICLKKTCTKPNIFAQSNFWLTLDVKKANTLEKNCLLINKG